MEYVLGFYFEPNDRVILIRKQKCKLAWMNGKFNGIGGKIETGETPAQAMSREFREEAGRYIHPAMWVPVSEMFVNGSHIHTYLMFGPELNMGKRRIPEGVVESVSHVSLPTDCLPNLRWLIPMHLESAGKFMTIRIAQE